MTTASPLSRQIVALAGPAFLALVAEPLFLLADTAIVGHLGTAPLAGLGVASAVLLTAANLFVFLAYGTTSIVARQVGAGALRAAASASLDGSWLAVGIGVVMAIVVGAAAEPLCAVFGASSAVVAQGTIYLRVSALGLPAMLVALAATGGLRGFQDTRTPMIASVAGFGANLVLNLVLVWGLGWGIAGSAWGTVIAQTAMAMALMAVLIRRARAERASLRPQVVGVVRAAATGVPLLVRTLALRAILLVTTWVAAGMGDVVLAAHQVTATVWTFQAFALDALAIAAQALTGKELGAGNTAAARSATTIMLRWGLWGGLGLGLVLAALSPVLPVVFTPDPLVQQAVSAGLLVVGGFGWLAGVVFVVDGVLIGAGDGRWLAAAMVATLALYLPVVFTLRWATAPVLSWGYGPATAVLWCAFIAFMGIRWAFLRHRVHGTAWLVVGAER